MYMYVSVFLQCMYRNYDLILNVFQEKFPPNIYYKIFTHRPVQDMCANSPKDYTAASVKLRMGRDIHNVDPTNVPKGTYSTFFVYINLASVYFAGFKIYVIF